MGWYWQVLICLVMALPAYWLQLAIHELSHLIACWIHEGRAPRGWYPYPHWLSRQDGEWLFAWPWRYPMIKETMEDRNWHLYFGRASSEPPEAYPQGPGRMSMFAPVIAGIVMGVLWTILLIVFPRLWFVFVPLAAFGYSHIGFWLWQYWWGSRWTDGKRYRYGDAGWSQKGEIP